MNKFLNWTVGDKVYFIGGDEVEPRAVREILEFDSELMRLNGTDKWINTDELLASIKIKHLNELLQVVDLEKIKHEEIIYVHGHDKAKFKKEGFHIKLEGEFIHIDDINKINEPIKFTENIKELLEKIWIL